MLPNTSDQADNLTRAELRRLQRSTQIAVPKAIRELLMYILTDYPRPVALNLWGKEYLRASYESPVLTVYFKHPGVLQHLLLFRDRLFLTECWLNKYFDFEGSLEDMIDFADYLSDFQIDTYKALPVLFAAWTLPVLLPSKLKASRIPEAENHVGSSAKDIQHHYDVSNDFYKLFLDPLMNYSCGHFEKPDATLAEAQEAKLDIICRKLMLKPGETFLDVGCGWGALVRWAAKHYGVNAYGITLSKAQLELCRQKIAEEGLRDLVSVELMDYRDLPATGLFDKIASVGMIEHVGVKNYPTYFSTLLNCLKPGGLFLCHGITTADESNSGTFNGKFVQRYIFPGGELANLPELIECARTAGWEVADVDAWRPHYVKTLQHWSANLQSRMDEAIALGGERVTKLWLLYMTASARGFRENWLRIYQTLLRRADDRIWNLPMERKDWLA